MTSIYFYSSRSFQTVPTYDSVLKEFYISFNGNKSENSQVMMRENELVKDAVKEQHTDA